MLTSTDFNEIMNWSSDEYVSSGSSWSDGNRDIGNSSKDYEENTEFIVENLHSQSTQSNSDVWHKEKYAAQLIPFTGTSLLVLYPGNKPYNFFRLCMNEELFA